MFLSTSTGTQLSTAPSGAIKNRRRHWVEFTIAVLVAVAGIVVISLAVAGVFNSKAPSVPGVDLVSTFTYSAPGAIDTKVGSTIIALDATCSMTAVSYTISPLLPNGILLNPVTGRISGTPTSSCLQTNHTVRAENIFGYVETPVSVTVVSPKTAVPQFLYPHMVQGKAGYLINTKIVNQTPKLYDGTTMPANLKIQWSVIPDLPNGLTMSVDTGIISGTAIREEEGDNIDEYDEKAKVYTVTATPPSGHPQTAMIILSISKEVIANVRDVNYTIAEHGFAIGEPVSVMPTIQGFADDVKITNGILPDGLFIDFSTGRLHGSPTVAGSSDIEVTFSHENSSLRVQLQLKVVKTTVKYPSITLEIGAETVIPPVIRGKVLSNCSWKFSTLSEMKHPEWMKLDSVTGVITAIAPQSRTEGYGPRKIVSIECIGDDDDGKSSIPATFEYRMVDNTTLSYMFQRQPEAAQVESITDLVEYYVTELSEDFPVVNVKEENLSEYYKILLTEAMTNGGKVRLNEQLRAKISDDEFNEVSASDASSSITTRFATPVFSYNVELWLTPGHAAIIFPNVGQNVVNEAQGEPNGFAISYMREFIGDNVFKDDDGFSVNSFDGSIIYDGRATLTNSIIVLGKNASGVTGKAKVNFFHK